MVLLYCNIRIDVGIEFTDVKNLIVPTTPLGDPNFTKGMPVKFIATGAIPSTGEQCTGANCNALYMIDGGAAVPGDKHSLVLRLFDVAAERVLGFRQRHDLHRISSVVRFLTHPNGW